MTGKHFFLTFTINTLYLPLIFGVINTDLLKEYFKLKSIHSVVILSCENNDYMLAKSLIVEDIFVTIYKIKTEERENPTQLNAQEGQQGFAVDMACGNISALLFYCVEKNLFSDKYKWLIFSETEKTLSLPGLSVSVEVTLAVPRPKVGSWKLLEMWGLGRNQTDVHVQIWGIWDPIQGFSFLYDPTVPKYVRRKDLSGIHFTGMIVLTGNYSGELLHYLYNSEENKTIDNFTRYYFLLVDHIKDVHNFTLSILVTGIFGSINSNGSFNGLVGALQRKEVDLGLAPIYYKKDRTTYVDYLVPTYIMKTRFLFRRPTPQLSLLGSFFSPLSGGTWLCTGLVTLFLAILLRQAFRYEDHLESETQTLNYTEYDWSYVVLLVFGGLCQQDVPRIPNLYSSRMIVFISVFFTYMLYQFYSGGIVSSLLSEPPDTIKNLKDLLQSDLRVGVEDLIYERDYFQQTTDPVAIELYKRKIEGKRNGLAAFYDLATGMEMVQQGGFAFQTDTSNGYAVVVERFSSQQACELREVQLYPTQYTCGVVQQDSPYKELLLYSFQRMVEVGLVQRQRVKWTARRPECLRALESSDIYVSLKQFCPAIMFFLTGIILSLIIFIAELWIRKANCVYF